MTEPVYLLVVEDLAPLRRRIVDVLNACDGVNVRAVGTVREALEGLEGGTLNGALVDRELPDGSGEEVLLAVGSAHPNAARVLMTGTVFRRGAGPAPPGVTVVEKPFSVERLESWVDEVRRAHPA